MSARYRVGLIVPSSNTTMETELPEVFGSRSALTRERFSFHAARMRMTQVTPEALAAMDGHSERCADELADAECDAMAYACLVAVMAAGPGAHVQAEKRLSTIASRDREVPVITSAGALVAGIRRLGAKRVALIAPYDPSLTTQVIDYLGNEAIEVVAAHSLGVTDNRAVGRLDPTGLVHIAQSLDKRGAEAVVASACVQMPSLPAIERVEQATGLPVLTAATATAWRLLDVLGLDPSNPPVPGGGALLR